MSYATSDRSFKKSTHFLDSLLNLKGDSISWGTGDPNRLAYQLRQAMDIAHRNPEGYPAYKELKSLFKISVSENKVTAVRRTPLVESEQILTPINFAKSVHSFAIPDVKDPLDVIGAIIANPNFEEYHFKDYHEITENELNKLYKYTSKNGLFIIKSGFLIISKKEPPENIAWRPLQ